MSVLEKAKLVEISSDEKATPSGEVDVQFNPTTLRLQLTASLPKDTPPGSQVRQSNGSTSATLSLDLVFDTADEGTTTRPVSVREKTAMVERFVIAAPNTPNKEKPPKLRFIWGDFQFDGVVNNITIDFDLFASDGTPLRAKVSLSIQEQNSAYMFLSAGPAARGQGSSRRPGIGGLGLGIGGGLGFSASAGLGIGIGGGIGIGAGIGASFGAAASFGASFGVGAQVGVALGGEALPEFAARMGMDPAAWRTLSADVEAGFSLEAGVEIGFDVGASASPGVGLSLGVEAGLSATPAASFGLDPQGGAPSATPGVGTGAPLASGFALSAGGGVNAALNTVRSQDAQAAVLATKREFAMPVPVLTPAKPAPPPQTRTPLAKEGLPSLTQQKEAPPAPPPPRVDGRALSFGSGVPLVPLRGEAVLSRIGFLAGAIPVREKVAAGLPPRTLDVTTPSWEALPARRNGNGAAGSPRRAGSCGCRQGCRGH